VGDHLTHKIGHDYIEDESQLPSIVSWILPFATTMEMAAVQVTGIK
jgi:hypothetical protein